MAQKVKKFKKKGGVGFAAAPFRQFHITSDYGKASLIDIPS